jgi:hypothetical protein
VPNNRGRDGPEPSCVPSLLYCADDIGFAEAVVPLAVGRRLDNRAVPYRECPPQHTAGASVPGQRRAERPSGSGAAAPDCTTRRAPANGQAWASRRVWCEQEGVGAGPTRRGPGLVNRDQEATGGATERAACVLREVHWLSRVSPRHISPDRTWIFIVLLCERVGLIGVLLRRIEPRRHRSSMCRTNLVEAAPYGVASHNKANADSGTNLTRARAEASSWRAAVAGSTLFRSSKLLRA